CSAASVSTTLRSAKEIVTASKVASGNGSRSASPASSGTSGRTARPARSMPIERSAPTAKAPERASSSVETPVPAPTSRTRSPGRRPSAARVARRQPRSWPKESTVLVRSYRLATPSNISATSCGCLSRSARVTRQLSHRGKQYGRDGCPSRPCLMRYIYDRHRSGPRLSSCSLTLQGSSQPYVRERNQREQRGTGVYRPRYEGAIAPPPVYRPPPVRTDEGDPLF